MFELREILKGIAGRVPTRIAEGLADYAVLRENPQLQPPRYVVGSREAYFRAVCELVGGPSVAMTYLEFGVHRGGCIRAWSALNSNPASRFIGFDSFEGLPSGWRRRAKGYFSLDGKVPHVADERVRLVKGWFNETLPDALQTMPRGDAILVNIDADLYSSALYCLTVLGCRLQQFHVMFDEVGAGEGRALRDWCSAFGATFTPLLGMKRASYSTLPIRLFGYARAGATF